MNCSIIIGIPFWVNCLGPKISIIIEGEGNKRSWSVIKNNTIIEPNFEEYGNGRGMGWGKYKM